MIKNHAVLATLLGALCATATAQAGKLHPGYQAPAEWDIHTGPTHDALARAQATGTLITLPSWTQGFTIQGQNYSYTLLGSDPSAGAATTVIPTVLIPIRLTVSDYIVNGQPLVLDATRQMPDIVNSPIFTPAKFSTGTLQFADAMLHAEFPTAPKNWHLTFSPSVAPTIDVTSPAGAVSVSQSKSGQYLGVINDGSFMNPVFNEVLKKTASPTTYYVFVTYNSLFAQAFGFHSDYVNKAGTSAIVWAYNSWLVGVNDLFTLPSPNADTFAHETAETVHDALGLSLTLEWGDWFNNNKCFQPYIEVGDAVEDAPAKVQNYHQPVTINGRQKIYTLQTEALLPWFERQYPSTAIKGTYSFPGATALLGPAPFTCTK